MACVCCGTAPCCKPVVITNCTSNSEFSSCGTSGCGELDAPCVTNGNNPATAWPAYCVNGAYQSGAWIKIENWTFLGGGLPPDNAIMAAAEGLLNSTFFMPVNDCTTSSSSRNFDFTLSSITGCTNNWRVRVEALFLCSQEVVVEVFNLGSNCCPAIGISYTGEEQFVTNPCAGILCNCYAFGGANQSNQVPDPDGTVEVYP
jgi:hypothetical protein